MCLRSGTVVRSEKTQRYELLLGCYFPESDEKPAAVNIHVATTSSTVEEISCGRSHSVVLFSDGEGTCLLLQ